MATTTLTPKQRAFVDHYVTCRNGAEAARRAGYGVLSAKVTASRLLTYVNVQGALAEKQAELRRVLDIDKNRVVAELLNGIEVAKQTCKAGSMISGWVQIAKMLNLYNHETNRDLLCAERGVPLSDEAARLKRRYETMSDDELYELMAKNNSATK